MTQRTPTSNPILMSHAQILSAGDDATARWTVEGFMRRGSLAMLAGESKSGKSALATHLAYRVAAGEPFLGMPVGRSPVLWITYEESADERAYLCGGYGDAPVHTAFCAGKIDTEEGIGQIRELLQDVERREGTPVGLLVIDPLAAAVATDSLAEMVKARNAVQSLNSLRVELDLSVLVLHHTRKNGGAKGDPNRIADSHQLQAAVSQWWVMEVRKGSPRMITLHGKGRGREANRDWSIRSTDEWTFDLVEEDASANAGRTPHERFLDVIRGAGEPMTSAKVASEGGLNRRYAQKIAKELLDAGKIRKDGKSSKSDLWALVA